MIRHLPLITALLSLAPFCIGGPTVEWSGPQEIDLFYLTDYGLDVDGNGTVDFQYGGYSGMMDISPSDPLSQNRFVVERDDIGLGNIQVLAPGTEIGPSIGSHPSLGWHDEDIPYLIMGMSTLGTGGPFVGVDDGLMGFSFVAEDGVHYGWAQMSYVNDFHITLDGWAYETQPGVPIVVGAVPEPSTWALMACGVGVLLLRRRRAWKAS